MNKDNQYICPPGTDYSIIASPSGANSAIEVEVMKEHRFAFYYWFKWAKVKRFDKSPALISIDWHQDLCAPCETEKKELLQLNKNSYLEVARFSWEGLNPLNDGHILAAAYLDLIGNIYVLCKQDVNYPETPLVDLNGKQHMIFCFNKQSDLLRALEGSVEDSIHLDIDLDFFTDSPDPCGGGENLTVMSKLQIENVIEPTSSFMQWCFQRIQGMTIATEPTFCGGIRNSNHIYNTIDSKLFQPPLLGSKPEWLHLST